MFKVDAGKPCPDFPPPNYVGQALFPYTLDVFQQWSVMAIARDENVLVTAKTGSGKTAVGLYLIQHCLAKQQRVFYTTPIKALGNQKFAELKEKFTEATVGLMTGDQKFIPDAVIVVMTQEILRTRLFKMGTTTEAVGLSADLTLDNLGGVVLDEAHYFTDPERGHAWEEALILLPPTVQVVLLSATMSAPEAFAGWLGDVRGKPITFVSTEFRNVPLVYALLDDRQQRTTFMTSKAGGQFNQSVYRDWLKARAKADRAAADFRRDMMAAPVGEQRQAVAAAAAAAGGGGGGGGGGGKPKVFAFKHVLNATVDMLVADGLCPALFFVLSRKGCEEFASQVTRDLLDARQAATVKHTMDHHLHRHHATLEPLQQYHTVRALALKGVAFHHSGVLPLLKEMVEILFTKGLIRVLFATETFAVGLNMPTKTAVFVVRLGFYCAGGARCCRGPLPPASHFLPSHHLSTLSPLPATCAPPRRT
jgi:superfamily II RNA helicase